MKVTAAVASNNGALKKLSSSLIFDTLRQTIEHLWQIDICCHLNAAKFGTTLVVVGWMHNLSNLRHLGAQGARGGEKEDKITFSLRLS